MFSAPSYAEDKPNSTLKIVAFGITVTRRARLAGDRNPHGWNTDNLLSPKWSPWEQSFELEIPSRDYTASSPVPGK